MRREPPAGHQELEIPECHQGRKSSRSSHLLHPASRREPPAGSSHLLHPASRLSIGRRGDGAGDMLMVLWFFLLLAIAAGSIALSMNIFFSAGYDIRATEATLLNERLRLCIEEHTIIWDNSSMVFSLCGLNADVMSASKTKLGVLVCEGSCMNGKRILQQGSNFEACDFTGKNEAFASCARGFIERGTMKYEIITYSNHDVERGSL